MGIFTRLSQLIRSNINDAIARAENPEKMLNQVLLDMREQLAKAKQEVAIAIADERKLRAQLDEEQKLATDWEHRAVLAVREGRDDLAKQALMRQQEHAERAASLEETWHRQHEETERLKEGLRQLNEKIEEAKRKKNLLVAKQKRAQAQKRIHETMAGLNDRSAFETFDRMAERIEETERRALAAAEVSEALSGDSLEQQFAQLRPASESVEFRLLQLKERMGMISSGSTERAALPGARPTSADAAAPAPRAAVD
ncbi:MAG: PspA/IM30 family protein, partial [Gemmatimonadetes bacterium]|nr:PspA/IM30 family protein [Gemmatimonadota bacterium]